MSKLGIHIISWNNSQPTLGFVSKAQPRIFKTLEFNDLNMDTLRASSPNTLCIGRQYVDQQPLDNPTANARDFFNALLPAINKMGNRIDVWEGYNEIILSNIDDAKRYNDFTVAWAQLMHAQGLKCAAYSFSTGNPDLSYWPYLADGARACDYLALHEYDAPRMDTHAGDLCLRYRRVRAALPPSAWRPILITECGIDDGNNNGWVQYASPNDYIAQLGWYDSELMKDDYVVGATIFTIDGKDWKNFELRPILSPIADYIIAHPSPVTPTPPVGVPSIREVTFTPDTLNTGQLLTIQFTVINNSSVTLPMQGPNPGFIYTEGETFATRGFDAIAGAFRVGIDFEGNTGIDHPYRWGLGAPLAPGQTATITGAIRMITPEAQKYWAGLVREQIAWLQDNQGQKIISVNSGLPPTGAPTISNVTFTPTTLNGGQLLNISFTVINNSNATLATQGPNPGFVYNEGQDFRSQGFTEQNGALRVGIDFDGRTGIDHPYRWGLGAPLAPGQSVTVNGAIRLNNAQARKYWAGLVREQISWLQDNQGQQIITVNPTPAPTPIANKPTITAVSFSPTSLLQGQFLQVTVTIQNNTNTPLPTQEPYPNFIYNEGDNFLTKNEPSVSGAYRIAIDYDGRIGIDHPYRWGLGAPLAPGQSVTVTGYIRLNRRQVARYWVGLVQELAGYVQDQQGITQILVERQ